MTIKNTFRVSNDWRGIGINRDRRHENLIAHLVVNPQTALFKLNKDLMVFAAMLGYNYNLRKPLSNDTIPITLGTYHNTEDDGYIYLLALMEKRDALYLKNDHLSEAITVFEEYCNGGLDLLQDWFAANPADIEKLDTLEMKILEYLDDQQKDNARLVDNQDLDVSF
ncbi:DNA phosphorothioation-associated protein 4 [Moraxella canis]|uniref:DNA phosphorothioation-associated protein 4 n=1 Tax=Moraxella canis TaxID=90239 RepID=UPI0006699402|nr:DNA phosphorothioation-associated protein 4 [Moraxella canis]